MMEIDYIALGVILICIFIAFIVKAVVITNTKKRLQREEQVRRIQEDRKRLEQTVTDKSPVVEKVKNAPNPTQSQTARTASYIPNSTSFDFTNRTSTYRQRRSVTYTERSDLTSWALHKQPGDIQSSDFIFPPSGDIVVHRDGGILKIISGPGAGRILSEWELDDYLDSL